LTYFDDAGSQPDPLMLKDYTWIMVQEKITKAVKDYID
jgi:hypothetical protein